MARVLFESDIQAFRTLASHEANDGVLENDLYGYSAGEAARYLIDHWADVRQDATKVEAFSTEDVLSDLDHTITALSDCPRRSRAKSSRVD